VIGADYIFFASTDVKKEMFHIWSIKNKFSNINMSLMMLKKANYIWCVMGRDLGGGCWGLLCGEQLEKQNQNIEKSFLCISKLPSSVNHNCQLSYL